MIRESVSKGRFVYATGSDGTLWALHLKGDQRVAWTYRVDGSWGAEPTAAGDMLYIRDNNGTVHAIDAASGKCRWKTTVTSSDSRSRQLFSKAAVSDRRVYLGAVDGMLYALDRSSGAQMWQQDCGDWIRSRPHCAGKIVCTATLDGKVVAVRDGFVIAADAVTGQRLWRFESGGRISAGLTTRDGRVFVGQVGGNQVFYALDLKTGRPHWSRRIGEIWASPECDAGQLFVGNKAGMFYCPDPRRWLGVGSQSRWTHDRTPRRIWAPGVGMEGRPLAHLQRHGRHGWMRAVQ